MNTLTHFWDTHSGGVRKEPQEHIFIEAPRDEAEVIFYNRFGHNPNRVSCTCCGEDYSIDEGPSLQQMTAFHRGCQYAGPPDERFGDRPGNDGRYMEEGEDMPEGWVGSRWPNLNAYLTLDEYLASDEVLVIRADEIKPGERKGELPEQGYVWID